MEEDDRSHVLIYQVLGISESEGKLIDVYQNKGRFLYKYAGSFLEEAAKLCFKAKFPDSGSVRVPNTHGKKPKLFGVDCLVGRDALEIKWCAVWPLSPWIWFMLTRRSSRKRRTRSSHATARPRFNSATNGSRARNTSSFCASG